MPNKPNWDTLWDTPGQPAAADTPVPAGKDIFGAGAGTGADPAAQAPSKPFFSDWGDVGESALSGLESVPYALAGTPGDLDAAIAGVSGWLRGRPVDRWTNLPTTDVVEKGAKKLGLLMPDVEYQSTSRLGDITNLATQALGSGAITGGIGGAARAGLSGAGRAALLAAAKQGAIRTGITDTGSALGSSVAGEAAPGNPLARVAGAVIGGGGTGTLKSIPFKVAAPAAAAGAYALGNQYGLLPDIHVPDWAREAAMLALLGEGAHGLRGNVGQIAKNLRERAGGPWVRPLPGNMPRLVGTNVIRGAYGLGTPARGINEEDQQLPQ